MDAELTSVVAGARAALGSEGEMIGGADGEALRFELFNGANSICSQKVRAVLAQHGLPYLSHAVNMFRGQTYLPGYVRLRMAGCAQFGGALVSHHSGSTSAGAGGCDGAVVPTLVDWQTGGVVVDSKNICLYLDAGVAEADRLRPPSLPAAVDDELAIVDNLPNYQMLMGRKPGASEAADTKDGVGSQFSLKKVALCDQYLREQAGDSTLVAAYTAKRAKELSAAQELFSAEAMRAAYGRAEEALHVLEGKLARRGGAWLCGERVTMADLFWGIELLRMKNMGAAAFWEGGRLPEVAQFAAATGALPSIVAAVVEWPGALF